MMVIKINHIAIILLLLVGTTGVTISQHYCGDTIRYTQLSTGDDHSSCCDDASMDMTCCHNEIISKQITTDFTTVFTVGSEQIAQLITLPYDIDAYPFTSAEISIEVFLLPLDGPPSHGSGVSIPILNQSFLI
jgi:hypothetical protein